jgi:phosphatidylserine decarboxylase
MQIARGGAPIIIIFLTMNVIFLLASFLTRRSLQIDLLTSSLTVISVIFGLLTVFSLYFFRDPVRKVPQEKGLVVSPADGRVLGVEQVEEKEFLGGPATKVSIFMSVFDVHVNRAPVSGTVGYKKYSPGKFFNASLDKASLYNESMAIGIESSDSCKVMVRQIAGLIARRIVCRVEKGSSVKRGARFGMIRFGSQLEVYLPPETRWQVAKGDRVKAGETILASLP